MFVLIVSVWFEDGIHTYEPATLFGSREACYEQQYKLAADLLLNMPGATYLADTGKLKVLCVPIEFDGEPA